MRSNTNAEALKEAIRRELPQFLRTDPDLRAYILDLTRPEFASREKRDQVLPFAGRLTACRGLCPACERS